MRIQGSQVAMAGAYAYSEQYSREESFEFWVGSRRPPARANRAPDDPPAPPVEPEPPPQATLPSQASASQTGKTGAVDRIEDALLEPLEMMLKSLLERMFGFRMSVLRLPGTDASCPPLECPPPAEGGEEGAPQRQGWGLDYQLRETRTESEQSDFAARGLVRTADGREIRFELGLSMRREFTEETQFRLRAGDALIDPLVINYAGTAAQLTEKRYAFDLNVDGQTEDIPFVNAGSAFLALDKSGDGRINNGGELFGPTTGDGFAELARYDTDRNSWIDENDAVYKQLRLMSLDGDGKPVLSTLAERQVGAIYLGRVSTPFSLKSDSQETLAQVASTGVYLKEQGGAGTVQQVNLVA